ncbi:MAG: hypothetical protein AAFR58_00410 [Cyanobacteria bacterium J06627_28]
MMLKKIFVGLGLSVAALTVLPTMASANTLLERTCRLELNDNTLQDGSRYDDHYFAGIEGQTVTVLLESEDFDPYLILEDPDGNRIGENDDIDLEGGNLNALVAVTLRRNGMYRVLTNSYQDGEYGTYTLLVSSPTRSPQPITDRAADCGNGGRSLQELQQGAS